jgi:arsenate reductase (thioredoxin)
VLRSDLLQLTREFNVAPLQRFVSLYGQFRSLDHGGGHSERKEKSKFHSVQCGKFPIGPCSPGSFAAIAIGWPAYEAARSKSWEEFASPGAPRMNFVFTVCDNAAKEVCPIWPGQPMTAHWGVADPATVSGTPDQIERAFRDAFVTLGRRINLLLSLPFASLDSLAIKKEIDRIGRE